MMSAELPRSAEIVIIGGGVIGTSIAWHLAKRGVTDVVVLERDEIASGATRYATGGIRQQFASEPDVKLSVESVRFYEEFEERVGLPFLFRQMGYLFLSSDAQQFAAMKNSAAMQQGLACQPRSCLRKTSPAAGRKSRSRASPARPSATPMAPARPPTSAYAFARKAREMGATVLEGAEVTGIEIEQDRVGEVRTTVGFDRDRERRDRGGAVVWCGGTTRWS